MAVGLCVGVELELSALETQAPALNQPDMAITNAISQHHGARTITADVAATFTSTGIGQITVHESVRVAVSDPLAPMLEDGTVQRESSELDGIFGLYSATPTVGTTTSLVSTNSTSTTVTSADTVEWSFPAGTQIVLLHWLPEVEDPDTGTLSLSVDGGLVAGVSGQLPTHRADSSVQFGSFNGNASVYVILAGADAQTATLTPAGNYFAGISGSDTGWEGLGSAALAVAGALWSLAIAYPAFTVFRWRQDRFDVPENIPATTIALIAGFSSAFVALGALGTLGVYTVPQGVAWMLMLPLLVLLFLVGAHRRVRLRPIVMDWANTVMVLCTCAGCVAAVFLPAATNRPVAIVALAFGCLSAAVLLAAVSPTHGAKLATILVPLAIVANVNALPTSYLDPPRFDVEYWLEYGAVPCALFGVSVAAFAWPLLAARNPRRKWRRAVLVLLGLSAIPVLQNVGGNSANLTWTFAPQIDLMTVAAATAALGVALMIRSGRDAGGVVDAGSRRGAIALLAIACAGYGWVSDPWAGFVVLLTIAAGRVLLPSSTTADGLILANVERRAHSRNVHRLQMMRTITASERQFHRDSVAALALNTSDRLSVAEYEKRSREFRQRTALASDQGLIGHALGTLAGSSPWESALAGLGFGTLIGLPLMAEIFVRTNVSALSVFQAGSILALAVVALHTARWLIYGLVYGYFYTRLRGQSAYAKAIWFAAIMTVPELAASWPTSTSQSVALGSAVVVLRLFAFAGVLATLWEIRQARRAGTGWDGVRNLRSMRALAAPSSAILLAVVTALATALASTEIPQWISPQQSKPSVSSTSHPG